LIGLLVAIVVVGTEISLAQIPLVQIVMGLLGAVLGIIAGGLLDFIMDQLGAGTLRNFWSEYSLLVKVLLGYLGLVLMVRKFPELDTLDEKLLSNWAAQRGEHLFVLDSSALVDGRIVDILKTRFIGSGTLIVSQFVLDELQKLADDADNQKRIRGRRGLDALAKIQEDGYLPLRILHNDYKDISAVDQKLVALARELKAKLVTTDYNLYKVSNIQGIQVLNVHDLAQALRPVVLPGESLHVFLVREGREKEQGVGYLDDGTMVVVEGGRLAVGKRVEVHVTSILQTSAGKMVFTKLANHRERSNGKEPA
jgi:uncharacterized protein YacL